MKLQILIPQYNEGEEVIENLLRSIEIQQGINVKRDVGVIIVNDGSDTILSDEFVNSFRLDIKYIKSEHKGVSAARNTALDAATADYIMFCDADDMFYNLFGLYMIFNEIKKGDFNFLSSVFVEEVPTQDPEEFRYVNHEMDSIFVHGKVFKRSFLIEKNIRWNEDLTVHEDSYFNGLAWRLAGEVKYFKEPFYFWKTRPESVCRSDKNYIIKTYTNMLDSSTALIKEILNHDMEDVAQFYCASTVYETYYILNLDAWYDPENQEYLDKTELRFKEYFNEFRELFLSVPEQTRVQVIMKMREKAFKRGVLLEKITFDDWITHIESL